MSNDISKLYFILEKIEDISTFKKRFHTVEELLNDKMGFDATLMCLLQIGESLKKLQNTYGHFDTDDIKGAYNVRNFIAHDYEGINKSIIESIIREHLPKLKTTIKTILKKGGLDCE